MITSPRSTAIHLSSSTFNQLIYESSLVILMLPKPCGTLPPPICLPRHPYCSLLHLAENSYKIFQLIIHAYKDSLSNYFVIAEWVSPRSESSTFNPAVTGDGHVFLFICDTVPPSALYPSFLFFSFLIRTLCSTATYRSLTCPILIMWCPRTHLNVSWKQSLSSVVLSSVILCGASSCSKSVSREYPKQK